MVHFFQVASEGIKRDFTQHLFDTASYTYDEKNGVELVQQVKKKLGEYFSIKEQAAKVMEPEVWIQDSFNID